MNAAEVIPSVHIFGIHLADLSEQGLRLCQVIGVKLVQGLLFYDMNLLGTHNSRYRKINALFAQVQGWFAVSSPPHQSPNALSLP